MKLENLIVKLRIEEDKRGSEKKNGNSYVAKANVVEHAKKPDYKEKKLVRF